MKFKFKSFKGEKDSEGESSQNPQAKRKDQIRRAQKTHRERKEAYTKSLEQEVIQLRANEAKIIQETRRLYAELTALKNYMASNGIQVPPSLTQDVVSTSASPSDDVFDLSIRTTNTKQKRRQIQIYKHNDHQHDHQCELSSAGHKASQVSTSPGSFLSPTTSDDLALRNDPNTRISDLDLTSVGMDFVLTLESPCLQHITDAPSDESTGHALMASATLLHHHPASHQQVPSQNSRWSVPQTGIEKLLELSTNVPLNDGEITPVQAWDALKKHPQFGGMEMERLRALLETLVKGVKCYGFGGVIEQGAFDNALFETFVIGRVF
ncbi:hypothetical protein HBI56_053580 [Parastagonospora nodorum]|uniref:BZIP domain-containing protein n=2 Tax=Phaeosphaeria nodorum (strain SN15 / ATCC MYA-4574 / FGSC 10173) TaxID=321614 RepID=A0A7U2NR39_PHANO|nr:hypothetical protein SNOG_13224 [Parastagonospora nodorum SN15]KAH3914085.1 hypothetical protein HBH56_098510 [Parastagonospora nodorum]EAT79551.1 hypothetical protein SNOG_13224 [Parastagonospora nodorum SN15]KAH3930285.1 hypothetical protein HBH54_112830 [Parastagonospora nodorum]KAH3938968.1 hypothetical protein HBH53_241850 [Parastagonospora nodorum]KAH3964477.1 hypothetical protein HBH51_159200 [Parastagonospora nodorum]